MRNLKNILAIFAGLVIGSIVNMSLIMLSGKVIPMPEGLDNTTTEGLAKGIHLFKPKHFLFPFLAHALGTFVGAWITTKLSISKKIINPLIVGGFFLIGGFSMVFQLPAPMWFNITDLVFAYIPMAYLGYLLGRK